MADGLVDVVLPSGETVSLPADAVRPSASAPAPTGPDDGGAVGAAAAGLFGAGSVASFGLSDRILAEGSYIAGGDKFKHDVLSNVRQAKEANPYSTMAGEFGGLLINPTVSNVGEAVEAQVAQRAGQGLFGHTLSMAARGGAEGFLLGEQKQVTEDILGDHGYNGEAVFAAGAKDALLGAALGGALGAGGYGLKKLGGGIMNSLRGPMSDAALDEIAGVEGAGRRVAEDAKQAQTVIEDFRKTGMTSEQAASTLDEIAASAKARPVDGGPATELYDSAMERVFSAKAAKNPAQAESMRQLYKSKTGQLLEGEAATRQHALTMSEKGTKSLRNLKDVVDEVQFTEKSSQFAKLVDPAKLSQQRDMVAGFLQEADATLSHWEALESRGIRGRDINGLRKTYNDTSKLLERIDPASPEAGRDLMIRFDKMKRSFDSTLQWGRENRFGLPEAITSQQNGLEAFTNRMRAGLEDEATWGQAGPAQARWNGSFSQAKARSDHFLDKLGVSIDQTGGVRIPEIDAEKSLSMLKKLTGGEFDASLQEVKSTESFISGMRDRVAAIREFGDLSPKQAAKLEQGLKDLTEFEASFKAARNESASINRLKGELAEEREAGSIGGLLGLAGDTVSKPLTTVQRLAQVRQTVKRVEEGVAGGLKKFFGGDGESTLNKLAEKLAPREKAVVAKEMGDIAAIRGNPLAMQERASKMVGDLSDHAPKIAREVEMTAIRALDYLAREAPRPSVPMGIMALDASKARYSDQQISEWEAKRRAALEPESVIKDMKRGKLNREAIQAVEFVSPKLFAKMQELAQEQIAKLAAEGKLDNMPYQQKAVISTLLKVPADRTWSPDFIAMMQAAKAAPAPTSAPAGPPQSNPGVSKRAVEINTGMFATESGTIEQGAA